jgi:hypothetical protein
VIIVRVKRYTMCAIFAFIVILQEKNFWASEVPRSYWVGGGWICGMDKSTLGR